MNTAGARGVALCVPEVPLEIRRKFLELASNCGNYRVCSFALAEIGEARRMGMICDTDLLALNQEEASALLGNRPGEELDARLMLERAAEFSAGRPKLRMVISVGRKGAYGFEGGNWQFCAAPVLRPRSTAGAGDALLAGVVSGLAAGTPFIAQSDHERVFLGRELKTALDLGVLNASFSVTSTHAIHPDATLENLYAFAEGHGASISEALRSVCHESEPNCSENVSSLA